MYLPLTNNNNLQDVEYLFSRKRSWVGHLSSCIYKAFWAGVRRRSSSEQRCSQKSRQIDTRNVEYKAICMQPLASEHKIFPDKTKENMSFSTVLYLENARKNREKEFRKSRGTGRCVHVTRTLEGKEGRIHTRLHVRSSVSKCSWYL